MFELEFSYEDRELLNIDFVSKWTTKGGNVR